MDSTVLSSAARPPCTNAAKSAGLTGARRSSVSAASGNWAKRPWRARTWGRFPPLFPPVESEGEATTIEPLLMFPPICLLLMDGGRVTQHPGIGARRWRISGASLLADGEGFRNPITEAKSPQETSRIRRLYCTAEKQDRSASQP